MQTQTGVSQCKRKNGAKHPPIFAREPSFDQVDIDDLYTQLEKQYKKYVHLGMEVVELECTAKVLRQYVLYPQTW